MATWDFAFYALFGIVVTSSVAIAGVLVVFAFLVIPAVIAFLFTSTPGPLIGIAWTSGAAATVLGLYVSYLTDWPTIFSRPCINLIVYVSEIPHICDMLFTICMAQ